MIKAAQALRFHVEELLRRGVAIPEPRSAEELKRLKPDWYEWRYNRPRLTTDPHSISREEEAELKRTVFRCLDCEVWRDARAFYDPVLRQSYSYVGVSRPS